MRTILSSLRKRSRERRLATHEERGEDTIQPQRFRQLTDLAAYGGDDNAECAAADLGREFPPQI